MSWFCIATNIFAAVPAKILWDKGLWGESLFTSLTGLASFIYHGNKLDGWTMNEIGIRNTDIILADLLVFHTVHLLIRQDIRWECSIAILPFVIYSAELSVLIRFISMIIYGTGCAIWMISHRSQYDILWVLLGIFFILVELVCFFMGNETNYVWLHGVHHITAFISQYCMIRSIKN